MFRPGKWATTFLFVYLHCFDAHRATKLENIQNCNKTRHILRRTYEIFEPRDWVEELKYLENTARNNLVSDKKALLQGTLYCQTCLNTLQDTPNQLYCGSYCGMEIYNLKNRSNAETQTLNMRIPVELKNRSIVLNTKISTPGNIELKNRSVELNTKIITPRHVELKNRSVDLDTKTTTLRYVELKNKSVDLDTKITNLKNKTLDAVYSIKNRSSTDNMMDMLSKISMISNHTEVFDSMVQLNRTKTMKSVVMDVMDEISENPVTTHNRTRPVDIANRTRKDGVSKIIVGNRTRTVNNEETMKNQRFSVAAWVMARIKPQRVDWEVELAVVIGRQAKAIRQDQARDYIFGYTVAQDISARDWQKNRNNGQFLLGKSMDTFCPLGPAVVTRNKVDAENLAIKSWVNGVLKQNGNTSELIFKIDFLVSYLSQIVTLYPGDVILTGTPAGVGVHRSPPEFLKPGDVLESEIEGIGRLRNVITS